MSSILKKLLLLDEHDEIISINKLVDMTPLSIVDAGNQHYVARLEKLASLDDEVIQATFRESSSNELINVIVFAAAANLKPFIYLMVNNLSFRASVLMINDACSKAIKGKITHNEVLESLNVFEKNIFFQLKHDDLEISNDNNYASLRIIDGVRYASLIKSYNLCKSNYIRNDTFFDGYKNIYHCIFDRVIRFFTGNAIEDSWQKSWTLKRFLDYPRTFLLGQDFPCCHDIPEYKDWKNKEQIEQIILSLNKYSLLNNLELKQVFNEIREADLYSVLTMCCYIHAPTFFLRVTLMSPDEEFEFFHDDEAFSHLHGIVQTLYETDVEDMFIEDIYTDAFNKLNKVVDEYAEKGLLTLPESCKEEDILHIQEKYSDLKSKYLHESKLFNEYNNIIKRIWNRLR